MQRWILFFAFLAPLFSGFYAQVPSDCTVPPLLATEYERDIKNLTLRRMYEVKTPDTAFVEIPQQWIDTIAEGMAAIFNATSFPERDSVFNLYCVHDAFSLTPLQIYQRLIITVDLSYAWTQAWQDLNSLTGYDYIDSLMVKYDLSVEDFHGWPYGNHAILQTDSLWNVYALTNLFKEAEGVIHADPDYLIGGAGAILYEKEGHNRYYEFYFEFYDCFDGCDNYRMWKFQVTDDCSVNYLGSTSWGVFGILPLPSPVNCNTFVSTAEPKTPSEEYAIYPNPATDLLTIDIESTLTETPYTLFDQLGRQLLSGKLNGSPSTLDISSLKPGLYFLRLGQSEGTVFRVVKGE